MLNIAHPADRTTSIATRGVRFFSYFTTESNLLVLAAVLPLTRDAVHDGWGCGSCGRPPCWASP